MKEFFKMLLACFVAMMIAGVMMMFVGLFFIGAMASMGEAPPQIPKAAVLVFDLSANINDAPQAEGGPDVVALALGGQGVQQLQLRKVVEAIDAAATDDRIKGLYLHGSFQPVNYGSGYGALLEVRAAVERFRASGKPVTAYLVGPTHRDYLLASAADRIVMNPLGFMLTPGLSADVLYMGGAFSRYGIGVQIARAGEYKTYGETYVKERMSDAEREQLTELLGEIWKVFLERVSASRGISPDELQALIDANGLLNTEQALAAKLIDAEMDFGAVLDELKTVAGDKPDAKTFSQVSLATYVRSRDLAPPKGDRNHQVAVVYIEGEIVDGEGGDGAVGGDKIARELRGLRRNDKVKAVVLRVNSPGGSAIASEVIRRELVLTHEKMPVVVSMGSYAASGGYWVATACDRIFAQDNTLTGSIGVFAMVPNIEGLAERFSLHFDQVKTAQHADIFSLSRPRSEESMAILQSRVMETYGQFLDRVAENRPAMQRGAIEALAGGRVWTGAAAVENGLADEIGGLHTAVVDAARRAGLADYRVADYPAARGFLEELLEKLAQQGMPMSSRLPAGEASRTLDQVRTTLESLNDPTGVHARLPFTLQIN